MKDSNLSMFLVMVHIVTAIQKYETYKSNLNPYVLTL